MFTQHQDLFLSRHRGKTEVAFDTERPTMAEIMTRQNVKTVLRQQSPQI